MSATIRFIAGSRKGCPVMILADQPQRLGRDPQCELPLDEGNVSRQHAQLSYDGKTLSVENLSSTNGIFINGVRRDQANLKLWDVVVIGSAAFRVEALVAPAQTLVDDASDDEASRLRTLLQCMLAMQRILGDDSERMIERSLESLFLALPATRLSLFTVDAEGEPHQGFTTTRGMVDSSHMSHGFARKVLAAGQAILLSEQEATTGDWGATLQEQHVQTILGAPVQLGERTVAVLLCDNTEQPNQLDDRSVSVIEFAAQALASVFQRQELLELELKQARAEREFVAAKRVQNQIFTKDTNDITNCGTWSALYQPAYDLGGDFYDFSQDEHGLTWFVADVSGKGIPAALVVSMLKGFCKTLYPQGLTPYRFLLALNHLFQGELPGSMFFTGILVRIEGETLRWCNVGHPPGLVIRGDGRIDELTPTPGMLGLWPDDLLLQKASEGSMPFLPGDRLMLYTDGLIEAMDHNQQLFDLKGVIASLTASRRRPVDQALSALFDAAAAHRQGAPLDDDITLVLGDR